MNEPVDPDSAVGRTARAWALAVAGEDFPPERSAQLRAWLDADPAHLDAYEHAEATLDLLSRLPLSVPVAAPGDAARAAHPPVRLRKAPGWRVVGPGLAALAACLVAAVMLTAPPAPFETAPGQTRQIALRDGSHVSLAPGSRLRVTSRLGSRALTLDRGEAFFVVAHRNGRPFTVQAGETRVQVVGTRFNVRKGQSVQVQVEQGVVQVLAAGTGGGRQVTLRAGQTAQAQGGVLRAGVLARPDQAGGWRQGRLAYEDVALSEVVADLNRYRARPLSLAAAPLGRLKVTAAFDVAQADRFVAQLPQILPVRVSADGHGGQVLVAATARTSEPHAP
ncbi:FecR family protein [Caulobacter sp. LARHSG274]